MGSFPVVPNPPMLESLRNQRALYETLKYVIAKMREIAQYVESTQTVELPLTRVGGPPAVPGGSPTPGYTTPPVSWVPSGQPQSDLVSRLADVKKL